LELFRTSFLMNLVSLRTRCRFFVAALLLLSHPGMAQQNGVVKIPNVEVAEHRIGEHEPLRLSGREGEHFFQAVELELIVSRNGEVLSATVTREIVGFDALAIAEAKTWHYKPFERNGQPVMAKLSEYVAVLPPEKRPKVHVAFPRIRDWNSLRITLTRSGCFGSCPSYKVEIHGNGTILFDGGSYVAIPGKHRFIVSRQTILDLVQLFRESDFLSLENNYRLPATDLPTYSVAIAFDNTHKSVEDYAGEQVGMPIIVSRLEQAVDRTAGVERWLQGNNETVPSLLQEGWNFKAINTENRRLLAGAAAQGNAQLVRDLVAAGAPLTPGREGDPSALHEAAARGELEMVRLLLEAGAGANDPQELGLALQLGAGSGNVELVKLLEKYGGDPHFQSETNSYSVLMSAARSGSVDVVREILLSKPDVNIHDREGQTALIIAAEIAKDLKHEGTDRAQIVGMLLKEGADLEAHDNDGETALFKSCFDPEVAHVLIVSGADVNARNNDKKTPLMDCNWPETVQVLVEAGADLNAVDSEQHTALEIARQRNDEKVAEILEKAQSIKRH
jgi:ankyrin repeat protein